MIGVYNTLLRVIINIMSHHYHRHWLYIWALLKFSTLCFGPELEWWAIVANAHHGHALIWFAMSRFCTCPPRLRGRLHCIIHGRCVHAFRCLCFRKNPVCSRSTDARFSYRYAFKIFTCAHGK